MFKENRVKISIILLLICCFISYSTCSVLAKDKDKTESKDIIYLTFDDGPSKKITNQILDILKAENVKATFFVIGAKAMENKEVLERIHSEGHTIGLHTYTHKMNKIYSNKNSFITEMDKTREEIKYLIGTDTNIIRFPWGSRGHLTKSLLEELHQKNYRIYDWNLCVSDGINPHYSPQKLYNEATHAATITNVHSIILLMHCDNSNKNTCRALPSIIKFYKDKGYEFKAIDNSTPEYYYKIKR